jgi:hypothetical protein
LILMTTTNTTATATNSTVICPRCKGAGGKCTVCRFGLVHVCPSCEQPRHRDVLRADDARCAPCALSGGRCNLPGVR